MTLDSLFSLLRSSPESIVCSDVIQLIDHLYSFTPTAFQNGHVVNTAEQNQASCRILAFAQMHYLSVEETLPLFGHYYFEEVIKKPSGTSHQNIRAFMQTGWEGVRFVGTPLIRK